MKFEIATQKFPIPRDIKKHEVKDLEKFSQMLAKRHDFVKSVFINRKKLRESEQKILPIIVLIDDISNDLKKTAVDSYLRTLHSLIKKTAEHLHVETMKFSRFWHLTKEREPNTIELLRDAFVIYDEGFVKPMKMLLAQGRIRPSRESTWIYFIRAQTTLKNSKAHLLQASLDLYWAVIDAGHAVLMKIGEIPPRPSQVATLLEEKLVKSKKLEKKYPEIMRKFYALSRKILHKQLTEIDGEEFDNYLKDATDFIKRMKSFLSFPA